MSRTRRQHRTADHQLQFDHTLATPTRQPQPMTRHYLTAGTQPGDLASRYHNTLTSSSYVVVVPSYVVVVVRRRTSSSSSSYVVRRRRRHIIVISIIIIIISVMYGIAWYNNQSHSNCLQCVNTAGRLSGRASAPYNCFLVKAMGEHVPLRVQDSLS